LLEDSGLDTPSLLKDSELEIATLLDDSTADDSVATGAGLLTASSLHAENINNEKDASIASTET
jgi:hypothetical protein